ncbi:hypothetical protein L1049_023796 [Liquidambar formosana]|uniref:Uncharacterized protein n=1 Tax=Liquidambar formosana TaxID=63359 RepID=A0AAP0X495_LIQFO
MSLVARRQRHRGFIFTIKVSATFRADAPLTSVPTLPPPAFKLSLPSIFMPEKWNREVGKEKMMMRKSQARMAQERERQGDRRRRDLLLQMGKTQRFWGNGEMLPLTFAFGLNTRMLGVVLSSGLVSAVVWDITLRVAI